jgi:hypothetical protein
MQQARHGVEEGTADHMEPESGGRVFFSHAMGHCTVMLTTYFRAIWTKEIYRCFLSSDFELGS